MAFFSEFLAPFYKKIPATFSPFLFSNLILFLLGSAFKQIDGKMGALNLETQNNENTRNGEIAFLDDEDDELPPPPPQNMLGNQQVNVVFRPPPILGNSMENNFNDKNEEFQEFPLPPPPINQFQYLPAGGTNKISTPSEETCNIQNMSTNNLQEQVLI